MHRATATQRTRIAQLGAAALVVAAGLAYALPAGPAAAPEIDLAPPAPPPAPIVEAAPEVFAQMRPEELAGALDRIALPVPVTAKPIEPAAAVAVVPVSPPPPPPPPLRYIGAIALGDAFRAIVAVNDRQRTVKPGDSFDSIEIVAIAADHLTIRKAGGADERIDLAPRAARTLLLARPSVAANPVFPAAAMGAAPAGIVVAGADAADGDVTGGLQLAYPPGVFREDGSIDQDLVRGVLDGSSLEEFARNKGLAADDARRYLAGRLRERGLDPDNDPRKGSARREGAGRFGGLGAVTDPAERAKLARESLRLQSEDGDGSVIRPGESQPK